MVENHYDDAGSDSPSWITETQDTLSWTRMVSDISGSLAATETQAGAGSLNWQVTNLHGDVVAVTPSTAAKPDNMYTNDEFGIPQTAAPGRYGWLGGKQRADDTPGGLTLMGVRLYTPTLGRFLSVDPVVGGNANAYVYPPDPISDSDASGMSSASTSDDDSSACTCTNSNRSWRTIYSKWFQSSWASMNTTWDGIFSVATAWAGGMGGILAGAKGIIGFLATTPYFHHVQSRYRVLMHLKYRCHDGVKEYNWFKSPLSTSIQLRMFMHVGLGDKSFYEQQFRTFWMKLWDLEYVGLFHPVY